MNKNMMNNKEKNELQVTKIHTLKKVKNTQKLINHNYGEFFFSKIHWIPQKNEKRKLFSLNAARVHTKWRETFIYFCLFFKQNSTNLKTCI